MVGKLDMFALLSMLFFMMLLAQEQSQATRTPDSKPYLNNGHSLLAGKERKVSSTKFLKRILLKANDDPVTDPQGPQLPPNPCENVPCQDDSVCIDAHFTCRCDDGTFGNEGFCYLPDPCVLQPCQSDDNCISPQFDVLCKCNTTGGSCYDQLTAEFEDDS